MENRSKFPKEPICNLNFLQRNMGYMKEKLLTGEDD
jgi:hypothetical protein